ncbi:MAG TPA: sulfatase-like hydrolase/transferase, partial [Pilimelia sp.]|nr:sulfatase-like hydrolase/transferase [Pilimelia sp.]
VGKHASGVRGWPLAALAVVAGAGVALAYARFALPGQLLRLAAVGPLAFALLFVFASPTSGVLLAGGGRAAPVAPARPHPPVVVVVLDEFPLVSLLDGQGRVDAGRLPNFARLARGSTWYRNATAVSGHTTYAVPALLSGRYATKVRAPHYSAYPDNLFTLLGGAYDIEAWENITRLCPPEHCPPRSGQGRGGLPAVLRESAALYGDIVSTRDSVEDPTASYSEPTVADRAAGAGAAGPPAPTGVAGNEPAALHDMLASIGPTDPPTLRFLHLLVPHSPWVYLPSGMRYDGPGGLPFDGDWWARLAHQRHLAQVAYADRLLGQLLDRLAATGQYDDSLIVVTSDHGDSFSQGVSGRDLDDAQRAAAELAWVPLFIKEPGQTAGRVDDRNWEHVDLLPTVADYAGVPVPWHTDGVSARGPARTATGKRFDVAPGRPVTLDGPRHFPAIRAGSAARPALPEMPALRLVGRPTSAFPVADGGPPATVAKLREYADVRPVTGKLPALVDAELPAAVPAGTPIAVAVNGRIGAVALAARDGRGVLRAVALVGDEALFVPGRNRLELFEVTGGGSGLRRLALDG